MAVTNQQVAELYVATFNRAPDADGLDYWVNLSGLTIEQIAQSFFDQAETQALYPTGTTDAAFVTSIYTNLFNRAPDAAGLAYWEANLSTGAMTRSVMIEAMKNGALGADAAIIANKATVALHYAVDLGLQGTTFSVASVTAYQSSVTTVTAQADNVAAGVAIDAGQTFTLTKSINDGAAFTGTAGNDTYTANYDAQATAAHTLGGLDVLDGGAGTDTLAITDDSGLGFALAAATISNIETMTIRGDSTVTADVSGSNVTGLNTISVTQAADDATITASATQDVNVSGVVNADADISVIGGETVTINHKLDQDADSISTVGAVNVVITATEVETASIVAGTVGATTENTGTVTITSTGEAIDAATDTDVMATIAVAGGTTISVTQSATSSMGTVATDTSAQTITGGAVTVLGGATTTSVTVVQDEAVAAVTAVPAVTGVRETITVTFGAMTTGETMVVNGLTFTAAKALTAAQVADAFTNFSPTTTVADLQSANGPTANGIYTGSFAANTYTSGTATDGATTSTVTFTEVTAGTATGTLALGGTAAIAATESAATTSTAATLVTAGVLGVTNGAIVINDDAAAADTITSITIDGYNGGATLGAVNSLDALTTLSLANSGYTANEGAVALTSASTTLNVTVNDVNGAVDLGANVTTLNLTASTANSTFASMTAGALTTLNVSGNAAVTTTSNLGALTTVTVAGSAGLTLAAANSATLTSINASATSGNVTASIDATAATYAGGTGVDTVTTTAVAPTKAITLGAGNDKITLASGTTAMGTAGTINAGADTDTLSMVAADAVTASLNTTFAGFVTNFERLELSAATGVQTVDANKLGSYNYVSLANTTAASNTTITGLTSGATIALADTTAIIDASDVSDVNVTAVITDAALVANASDVLNIAITANGIDGTADNQGIVTAANVENINISVTDGVVQTPTNTGADAQTLALVATSAKTITITGDTALTLTNNANTAVTAINASAMTAALTVTAAGTVASTITGGSGNDVLTASTGATGIVGADNATGTNDVIADGATVGGTAAVPGVKEVFVATFAATTDADSIDFDGSTTIVLSALNATAAASAAEFVAQYDGLNWVLTDNLDGTVTFEAAATGAVVDIVSGDFTVTSGGGGGDTTVVAAAPTTQGVTAVPEVLDVDTIVLTDGTNTGLTTGDTMAIVVDMDGAGAGAATTFTYTATADVTMDVAAAALAALVQADAGISTAVYDAGTNTMTLTEDAGTANGISITSYTVTDATSSSTVVGDTLIGGAGNDTLNAGNLAQLTGGAGNDTFVMNVPTNVNSYSTITDLSAGDVIDFGAATTVVFSSAAITLASTAVFQDYANAAVNALGTDTNNAAWFQFGTNTYIVQSGDTTLNNDFQNGVDSIIQITGLVDLSTASYNQTQATLEIA